MTITRYSFGKIVIDGRAYTSDVMIYPGEKKQISPACT